MFHDFVQRMHPALGRDGSDCFGLPNRCLACEAPSHSLALVRPAINKGHIAGMLKSPKILAVGGAHIDRRGQVSGAYVPAASNPGTMREDVGGGVFNALRSAVRRGVAASLLSVRGGDAAAETVSRAIAEAGIADLSAVFLDRTTPSYTALIDRDGELIVGFADMALYDLAFPKQIRRSKVREVIAAADAVLCDANLPSSALERLVALAAGKPVFAIAISPAKVVRLIPVLGALALRVHEPARGHRAGRRRCQCRGARYRRRAAVQRPQQRRDDGGRRSGARLR